MLVNRDFWQGDAYLQKAQNSVDSGKKFMVSTSHPKASKAAKKILAKGGSAIDAAIAAQMVLNVVEMQSSGIGGGGFLMYYDGQKDQIKYYDGREFAPQNLRSNVFLDKDGQPISFDEARKSADSIGVPMLLKILKEAHLNHGKLFWDELFIDAIKTARNGFRVYDRLIENAHQVGFEDDFLKGKKTGDLVKNKQLALVLEKIARNGIDEFYFGSIGQKMVDVVQKNGGLMSMVDLKRASLLSSKEMICGYYLQHLICGPNLPSSGTITLLEILGVLEQFESTQFNEDFVHLFIEAAKLAYADRNAFFGDVKLNSNAFLNEDYFKKRALLIDENKAATQVKSGYVVSFNSKNKKEGEDTTHISIIDADGNAVSLTSSIEYFFGSTLMTDGFLLNNQLTDFAFETGHPNSPNPLKKPRSSMTPILVLAPNGDVMVLGSPGGAKIIQLVAKVVAGVAGFGMGLDEAIALPNIVVLNDVVKIEKHDGDVLLKQSLTKKGHDVKITALSSGVNAVLRKENGDLVGVADFTKKGLALGK